MTRSPDVEQVVSVKVVGHTFPDEERDQGVQVIFPGSANAIADRLLEQQQVPGDMQSTGNNGSDRVEFKVETDGEVSFEPGDLASAMV
jgi:hypothetical protein